MNMIPVQEIKRRGISAVDAALTDGPVYVLKNNRAQYVILAEKDYRELMKDLAEARIAASERDLMAERVFRGSAAELMQDILVDE